MAKVPIEKKEYDLAEVGKFSKEDGKYYVNVDADLNVADIQIGAVEIKDGDTDTRLDVELDVTKNASFVQSETLSSEATLDAFKTDNITNLQVLNTSVEDVKGSVDDFATQNNVDMVDLKDRLDDIEAIDFALEATQDAFKIQNDTNLNDIEADVEAVNTTQTDKTQFTQITDGTNDAAVTALNDLQTHNNPRPGTSFASLATESGGSAAMNVDGSVTPVDFDITPNTGFKFVVQKIVVIIEDTNITFKKFGGINNGITNGLVLFTQEGGLAERQLSAPLQLNTDFYKAGMDVEVVSALTDLLIARFSFQEISTSLELSDSDGDYLRFRVQDDLTPLDDMKINVQGYEVAE